VPDPRISLGIVALVVVATLGIGSFSMRSIKMDAQQYTVGGRSFGSVFLWILLAGEIYTSFTFLGAAGWAYGKGAPAFYILCYGTVAYGISFFLLPEIWRVARDKNLLTGADFFVAQYDSKALGGLVALIGFVFLVPYVTLQLSGIATLLRIAGYGSVNAVTAVGIAFASVTAFTFFGGLHATARASIVKDVLVIAAVIFAGLVMPIHFFGSPAGAIVRVLAEKPGWMTLAGPSAPNGTVWFVSTVALTAMGFYMFPQSMAAVFSAKNPQALRHNAIFLPLYQLVLLLVYFAGFTALVVVPGLKGPDADQSFMLVVQKYYPSWLLGAIAAAGTLAGLVPASGQILGAASLIAKNVLVDYGLIRGDRAQTIATRVLVVVVAVLAFGFWAIARTTLVGLLLIAYNGIAQFFPGVVLSFSARIRPRPLAVGAGMIAGIATLSYFAATGAPTPFALNAGLVALALNLTTLGLVDYALKRRVTKPLPA
jgi:SSS family solute:Na+ symporter